MKQEHLERNLSVDILRGFLIFIIMFFHYTYRFSEIFSIETLNFPFLSLWGIFGVGAFFVISGYYMIHKVSDNFSIKFYLKSKFLRLYPAYFFSVVLVFAIVSIFKLPGREVTIVDFFLNIFLLNGFLKTPYVDGAHWYLTYLLLFYVLISFFIKFVYIRKKNNAVFGLLILLFLKDLFKVLNHFIPKIGLIYFLFGKDYLEFIMIGISIYFIISNHSLKYTFFLFLISLLHIVIFQGIEIGIFICLFSLIFYQILKHPKNVKEKFFLYHGKISYILYLIHQNIGYVILLLLVDIFSAFHFWYIFIAYGFILFLSSFIYIFYDQKIQLCLKSK